MQSDKEAQMAFRDMEREDYRGVIAIVLVVGIVALAIIALYYERVADFTTMMAVLAGPLTMVLKDYFQSQIKSKIEGMG